MPHVASSQSRPGAWTSPWLILLVAFALRALWAAAVPIEPLSDAVLYDAFARSIASGQGYAFPDGQLTLYWPVGAPALYAAVYGLFGPQHGALLGLNLLLGTAAVGLTSLLARRVSGSVVVAALAGWLMALWPGLIQYTTVLASELPFIVLLLLALQALLAERWPAWARALGFGLAICGASFVRPVALPLIVLLPLALMLQAGQRRAAVWILLGTLLVALATIGPWAARNQRLTGHAVLISANGGANLWMGNNPQSDGGYMPLLPGAYANEVERDRFHGQLARRYIAEHPGRYLQLCVKRFITTYGRETIGVVWNQKGLERRWGSRVLTPLKALASGYWLAVFALAWAGVGLTLRRRPGAVLSPWLLTAGLMLLVPILTVSQDRYHLPLAPFVALAAAIALNTWAEARARRPSTPP